MIKGIDHVTIVVKDLRKAIDRYATAFELRRGSEMAYNGIRSCFLYIPGTSQSIYLVQPVDSESPVSAFMGKDEQGLFGVAVLVDDLDEEVKSMRNRGIKVNDPTKVPSRNAKYVFLKPDPSINALFEIVEHSAGYTH